MSLRGPVPTPTTRHEVPSLDDIRTVNLMIFHHRCLLTLKLLNLIHINQSLRLTFHHILKRGTAHYVGLIEYTSPNFVGFHKVYGFHEYDIARLLCFLHICLIKNLINILYSN